MKKYKVSIFAPLVAAAIAVSLTGCAQSTEEKTQVGSPAGSDSVALDDFAAPPMSDELFYAGRGDKVDDWTVQTIFKGVLVNWFTDHVSQIL